MYSWQTISIFCCHPELASSFTFTNGWTKYYDSHNISRQGGREMFIARLRICLPTLQWICGLLLILCIPYEIKSSKSHLNNPFHEERLKFSCLQLLIFLPFTLDWVIPDKSTWTQRCSTLLQFWVCFVITTRQVFSNLKQRLSWNSKRKLKF